MKQWIPFVNSNLLQIQEDPFQSQSTGFKFTPTKRGFSPITEPVVSPTLPSYTIYSISLLSSHPAPGSAIHIIRVGI